MEIDINESNNFCRVFELPDDYPPGYCHSGGKPVIFLMVDWFSPIPVEDFPSWGGSIGSWEKDYKPMLEKFITQKLYIKPKKSYLVITNFGESIIVTSIDLESRIKDITNVLPR